MIGASMSVTGHASVNITVMESCVYGTFFYKPFYLMLIAADVLQFDGVRWTVKPLQAD